MTYCTAMTKRMSKQHNKRTHLEFNCNKPINHDCGFCRTFEWAIRATSIQIGQLQSASSEPPKPGRGRLDRYWGSGTDGLEQILTQVNSEKWTSPSDQAASLTRKSWEMRNEKSIKNDRTHEALNSNNELGRQEVELWLCPEFKQSEERKQLSQASSYSIHMKNRCAT